MLKSIKKRAFLINKKKKVKILFLENDKRIRNAIKVIKREKIAEPVLLKGNIKKSFNKAKIMLDKGKVDAIISGATHYSSLTLYFSFNFIRKNVKRISGSFLMISPQNRILLFADCAAQPNPDAKQLAEIAILSAETFKLITKKKPRIALLSYSTHRSGKGDYLKKIKKALRIIKEKKRRLIVDGEIQADAALNLFVAKMKRIKPFNANVLVFPCLNSANIGYKLVEQLAGWHAIGPILQGLRKPINDLSRGCQKKDIINLAAITVLQVDSLRKEVKGGKK
jgi:phosphate acetyltransferase